MYIMTESPSVVSKPLKIQQLPKKDYIRIESILQTVGDINKNKRRYSKELIESGLSTVEERIKEGSFLGELDHPVDTKPARQVSVLFDCASHRILEYGWDGNKLISVLETLDTPKGHIQRNLALQGVPVGYSFRGMGELKPVTEADGRQFFDVSGPLHIVTWDAVSNPSHKNAKIRKISESTLNEIQDYITEQSNYVYLNEEDIFEKEGFVCTKEGFCYLPNQFDKLVEERCIKLINKFKV